ncbi:MAG: hypothetical protein JWR39_1169 [Devosia sp.]|jgi:hypothetical protein|nr:hypothetical protein [Devosia sp.]
MRQIEVLDGVRVRFPGRGSEFDLGVEIGAVTALMVLGEPVIERRVSPECVEQLRPLAERFRYRLVANRTGEEAEIALFHASRPPRLQLVQQHKS